MFRVPRPGLKANTAGMERKANYKGQRKQKQGSSGAAFGAQQKPGARGKERKRERSGGDRIRGTAFGTYKPQDWREKERKKE